MSTSKENTSLFASSTAARTFAHREFTKANTHAHTHTEREKRIVEEFLKMARQQLMGASSSSSASSNGENRALLMNSTAGLRAIANDDAVEKKKF